MCIRDRNSSRSTGPASSKVSIGKGFVSTSAVTLGEHEGQDGKHSPEHPIQMQQNMPGVSHPGHPVTGLEQEDDGLLPPSISSGKNLITPWASSREHAIGLYGKSM